MWGNTELKSVQEETEKLESEEQNNGEKSNDTQASDQTKDEGGSSTKKSKIDV